MKDNKRTFIPAGAQVPKMQSTQNHHGKDSGIAPTQGASIPRMQAENNDGQEMLTYE